MHLKQSVSKGRQEEHLAGSRERQRAEVVRRSAFECLPSKKSRFDWLDCKKEVPDRFLAFNPPTGYGSEFPDARESGSL